MIKNKLLYIILFHKYDPSLYVADLSIALEIHGRIDLMQNEVIIVAY